MVVSYRWEPATGRGILESPSRVLEHTGEAQGLVPGDALDAAVEGVVPSDVGSALLVVGEQIAWAACISSGVAVRVGVVLT